MELLTVMGAAVRDPAHQLSVHVLHVCHVLLKSAPFMHCVHHHSAEGFASLVLFILFMYDQSVCAIGKVNK